ncbi:hypothetical protein J7T55_010712 [Diaporthe amygdali]|uniref:uncharacterized protein n=1 Tax=Phomopsis amygdali TaxID=1214568 RepID=UPI0022FEF5AA|nr:uncharacterized protein J7T55_010712 [Diaporthe amygdali]KAJ0114323.1 hypothetical protein J7T55_010712 [Diaporthe amygdali]
MAEQSTSAKCASFSPRKPRNPAFYQQDEEKTRALKPGGQNQDFKAELKNYDISEAETESASRIPLDPVGSSSTSDGVFGSKFFT